MLFHNEGDTDKEPLDQGEVIVLSGSVRGSTVNKKPFMNTISHGFHHLVAIHDIFD